MHVKNKQMKTKFKKIFVDWNKEVSLFKHIKEKLYKDSIIIKKEQRNIIAGLITKKLKPKKKKTR